MNVNLILALVFITLALGVYIFISWSNKQAARKHTQDISQQHKLLLDDPDVHRLCQAVHLVRPAARPGFDYLIQHQPGELPYIAEWNTGGTMPTQAELDAALKQVPTIDSTGYAAMRRAEYPGIEDQLDAAYKARQGDPTEQQALDARITEIKEKYPKSDDEM